MTAPLASICVGLVIIGLGLNRVTVRRIYAVAWVVLALFIASGIAVHVFGVGDPNYTVNYSGR